jgi:hypothetical protein
MAKLKKTEREEKVLQAKQMYCKGFDTATIAAIMGSVTERTVANWVREFDFDKSKKSQIIALSEIRNSILESYADLLDGKQPKVKPDEAAKYATAFEKFSSKKQVLSYMHEAYEMLTDTITADIQKAKTKEKQTLLEQLKYLRNTMDKVLTKLTNEQLGTGISEQ